MLSSPYLVRFDLLPFTLCHLVRFCKGIVTILSSSFMEWTFIRKVSYKYLFLKEFCTKFKTFCFLDF